MPLPQKDYQPASRGPLQGVRVIDLSRLVAGNALTMVLADFGAEVIKVEPPEGDTLRGWKVKGIETTWKVYARNKKSLCIDFRKPGAIEVLRRLVSRGKVLVESFRPGTLEAMGLAPDDLLALNPKLVIVRISGWGQTGPYSHRPGFGTLIEGMSGFASMNGFPDREPCLPPMYLADSVAALYGASALMMALREVEVNGGSGQVIDLPLLDPLMMILGPQAANHRLTGRVTPRVGSGSNNSGPRNVYRTKDGRWACLSASTQKMAERLLRSIGREELISDPRFADNTERVKNAAQLDAEIGKFIGARTLSENVAFFDKAGVTIGPICDITDIMQDPHVLERGILAEYEDADMGRIPQHEVVPRLLGTPGAIRSPAPRLGQHNTEVLSLAGLAADEIRELREAGIVREAGKGGSA